LDGSTNGWTYIEGIMNFSHYNNLCIDNKGKQVSRLMANNDMVFLVEMQ